MNLLKPVRVASGVYQLRVLGARVTVLFTDEGVVLVDAGNRFSLGLISAGLRVLGTSLEDVGLIVITHHHPDHTGGLAKLVEATSAKVAAHRLEAGFLTGEEPTPNPFHHSLLATVTQPFLRLMYTHPVEVHYLLDGGAVLPLGENVSIVHTPGHSPGSICLYLESVKVLIVGDALQYRFRRLSPPAWWVTGDYHQAVQSLKKLMAYDFRIICFSHFPALRLDARGALGRLIL